MWKKDSTGTTESQVSKRVIIGIDMGGNLWATVIHDCMMRKDRYYGLKDRDEKRKEDRFYDLLREYLGQGYAVDVFYEAGRYGFAPARIMLQLGAKVHILPINKLKVIMCGKVIKTDKLDAKFLSGLDPEAGLPEVYIPTVEQESRRDAERELVRLSAANRSVRISRDVLRGKWRTGNDSEMRKSSPHFSECPRVRFRAERSIENRESAKREENH